MSGFRKAKAEQAALKISMYGPPGSGKTFTALLVAEGLAGMTGKRIAFVDTERGTDFYCQRVAGRATHPEAFEFDALYTRSLTEVLQNVKSLDPDEYGVIIIDSITHLWEAAKAAFSGRTNKVGQIPMWAWSQIKAPYKALMQFLINCPQHVFILGRQANEFAEDEASGEVKATGVKMKAEGETQYEPHICLRMEAVKPTGKKKGQLAVITAYAEKDRTGVLQGRTIELPNWESIGKPLVGLLGGKQAQVQSEDDAALQDAEAISRADRERVAASQITREQFEARLTLARELKSVEAIGREITPQIKKTMTAQDVARLRESYLAAHARVKGLLTGNGTAADHEEYPDNPRQQYADE